VDARDKRGQDESRSGALGIQRHGGANENLERCFIDLIALTEIDGAPQVAFEAGVEQA
jgi:hypothetical protein